MTARFVRPKRAKRSIVNSTWYCSIFESNCHFFLSFYFICESILLQVHGILTLDLWDRIFEIYLSCHLSATSTVYWSQPCEASRWGNEKKYSSRCRRALAAGELSYKTSEPISPPPAQTDPWWVPPYYENSGWKEKDTVKISIHVPPSLSAGYGYGFHIVMGNAGPRRMKPFPNWYKT